MSFNLGVIVGVLDDFVWDFFNIFLNFGVGEFVIN